MGLSEAVAAALSDTRRLASCDHDLKNLIRQRLCAIALGYEDLNDHADLSQDVALQTAMERDRVLASSATLCRFENRADRDRAFRVHEVLLEQFIDSFKHALKQLILDFDATELAKANVGTIRLKLFKIGVVVLTNTRRIRFLLTSGPYQALYCLAARRLAPR